jgi:hypothetical protein
MPDCVSTVPLLVPMDMVDVNRVYTGGAQLVIIAILRA